MSKSETRLVWSDPIEDLAQTLREEAAIARRIVGDISEATLLERSAERIEEALRVAGAPAWIPLADAAHQLGVEPDTLRARCRRRLEADGLAKKQGADWLVHARALLSEAA